MLASIASSSRPACSLHMRAAGIRSLGQSSAITLRSLDQTRGIRHGSRGSYINPDSSQESVSRQSNRIKPLEAKNSKLAWDKHPDSMPVCKIEKRMASHYQRAQKSGSLGPASGESTGWAGDNIEAVERGALENLLFGHKDNTASGASQPKSATPPLSDTSSQNAKQTPVKTMPREVLQSTVEPEYMIDPITNRKVLKSSAETSEQLSGPVFDSDLPVTSEELKGYRQVKIDEDGKTVTSRHGSVFWHWDSGVKIAGVEAFAEIVKAQTMKPGKVNLSAALAVDPEPSADKYTDLNKYKPVLEPQNPAQDGEVSQYEDLDKYKPVMEKRTSVPEDPSAEYKDLDQYNPVMEKRTPVPEDPSAQYDDLDKYTSVAHNEPDGKIVSPFEKETYTDLALYTPVAHNEPDGKVVSPFEKETYTDLSQYNPVMYNEPDGKALGYEQSSYDPVELAQYGAFMYNEPDGKPPTAQEPGEYKDLNLYGKAVRYQEPDGKPASAADENKPYEDLEEYSGPVLYLEPDGKPLDQTVLASDAQVPPEPYTDLGEYEAGVRYQEPDGKAPRSADSVAQALGEFDTTQKQSDAPVYSEPTDAEREVAELERLRATEDRDEAAARALFSGIPKTTQHPSGNAQVTDSKAPTPSVSTSPRGLLQSRLTGSQRIRAVLDPFSRTPQGLETSYADECAGMPTWPTYVRTYGDLGTSPHEVVAAESAAPPPAASVQPTVYRILAYDPTMQAVTTAEIASTVPDTSSPLPATEALLKLSHPTKFFPYFAHLQEEGFEIVSGNSDVLVFRKMWEFGVAGAPIFEESKTPAATPNTLPDDYPSINPIDMTGSQPFVWEPASAKFASPTGYVRYEPEPADDCRPQPPRFGQQDQHDLTQNHHGPSSSNSPETRPTSESSQRRQPARLAKRMVVGATWVAGLSYGLGVVGEYFNSGGTDGKGPTRF